jgi:ribosome-associated protein
LLAIEFARILKEYHCRDIQVLDVTGVSPLCNFVVVSTGTSRPQMKSVLYKLEDFAKAHGEHPLNVPDQLSERWMLADYVDVVVHIFSADWRHYYDLEMLWGDVPRVPLDEAIPA